MREFALGSNSIYPRSVIHHDGDRALSLVGCMLPDLQLFFLFYFPISSSHDVKRLDYIMRNLLSKWIPVFAKYQKLECPTYCTVVGRGDSLYAWY